MKQSDATRHIAAVIIENMPDVPDEVMNRMPEDGASEHAITSTAGRNETISATWSGPERSRYTDSMEVHFSRETEARLAEAAARSGCPVENYVRELVERYLDEDIAFREAVRKGFASLDRGNFIDEEEMTSRVEKMLA